MVSNYTAASGWVVGRVAAGGLIFLNFLMCFSLLKHFYRINQMQLENIEINLKEKLKHQLMYIKAIISLVKS